MKNLITLLILLVVIFNFTVYSKIDKNISYYFSLHPAFITNSNPAKVKIFLLSKYAGSVIVEIGEKGILQEVELQPDKLSVIELDAADCMPYIFESREEYSLKPEGVFDNAAVVIYSNIGKDFLCYAIFEHDNKSEAIQLMRSDILGKIYQVSSNVGSEEDKIAFTSIIGIYDNTKVTFRIGGCEGCSIKLADGDTAKSGSVIRRTVNQGDVWLLGIDGYGATLSGSKITATKPIGVISGASYNDKSSSAYIAETEIPESSWGSNYILPPIANRKNYQAVQIFAKKPNTTVSIDSAVQLSIASPGGTYTTGFRETRAGLSSQGNPLKPVVISGKDDYPINVVLYNLPQKDDGVKSAPFKMQMMSNKMFKREFQYHPPNYENNIKYDSNYLAIVYKPDTEGRIPDDFKIGLMKNGNLEWTKLNVLSPLLGQLVEYFPADSNGRKYYVKTLQVDNGIIYLENSEKFAAYAYGFNDESGYGFPVNYHNYDNEVNDTLAPTIEFSLCCCGKKSGGTVIDEPKSDPENRSNLGLIYMDNSDSYNYTFDVAPYMPGADASTGWTIAVNNLSKNARAHLVFQDKAGNRRDTVIVFTATSTEILEKSQDFGYYILDKQPKPVTKIFTFKNASGSKIESSKYGVFVTLDSKINELKTNDIRGNQNFRILDIEDRDITPLEKDREIKVVVEFTPYKIGTFKDSIGIVLIRKPSGDTCSVIYFTELTAEVQNIFITANDYDFGIVETGSPGKEAVLGIDCMNNSSKAFKLDSIVYDNLLVGKKGTNKVFEIEKLLDYDALNPLRLLPGESFSYNVKFTPKTIKEYKTILELKGNSDFITNKISLSGIGTFPSDVDENVESVLIVSPNPASDFITINPGNKGLKPFAETDEQVEIYNSFGELVLKDVPHLQDVAHLKRIDVSHLPVGLYFVKIGNRVEKFVKI